MKTIKLISSATVVMFLAAVAQQPIVLANMIDDTKKRVEAAQTQDSEYQKMQKQQQKQDETVKAAQASINNNTASSGEIRQTIYDSATGQFVTIVKNGYAISAYNAAGQQITLQADWLNQIQTGTTSNISGTTAQQLSTIASTIKTDSSLNSVGKLIKALLALEAIKSNNQIMRQQYARQLQQQAQAQPTAQQQTTTPQKKDAPTTKKGTEQAEYAGYLRDSADQTGGTSNSITITNPDSAENKLSIDLIGKIIAINGNVLTIQDSTGRKINVKVTDPESYAIGDNLNATGSVLSGSDGNLYVVKDLETDMDVRINKISDDSYNYKVEQQQAQAQQFTAEYPEANGLAGTGAAGSYYQAASDEVSSSESVASPETTIADEEQPVDNQSTEVTSDNEEPGFIDKAVDWYKKDIKDFTDNISWGKAVSAGAALAGVALIGTAIAGSVISGGATLPVTAPMFQAGVVMTGLGIGTYATQDFYQDSQEKLKEKTESKIGSDPEFGSYKTEADNTMNEVNSHFEAAGR